MTNREWLATLTDKEFAEFAVDGVYARRLGTQNAFPVSAKMVYLQYTQSALGFEQWLAQPQEYEIEDL